MIECDAGPLVMALKRGAQLDQRQKRKSLTSPLAFTVKPLSVSLGTTPRNSGSLQEPRGETSRAPPSPLSRSALKETRPSRDQRGTGEWGAWTRPRPGGPSSCVPGTVRLSLTSCGRSSCPMAASAQLGPFVDCLHAGSDEACLI